MPDEYISREAALTALQDSDLFNTTERQLRAIRELPAADVAQVVRCRDCAAWKRNVGIVDSPNGHCFEHDIDTNGQDFCSYGKYQTNTGGATE